MKLIEYKGQNKMKEQIEHYHLPKEQAIFSGLPKDSIMEASKDKSRYPIMLVTGDASLITFFVLHEKAGVRAYSDNEQAILLRSFSTDSRYQGKGYGKLALQLLPDYIKNNFESINEIVLAVNSVNVSAIGLYDKSGFIDTNRRIKTDYGELAVLSQTIK